MYPAMLCFAIFLPLQNINSAEKAP